MTSRNVYALMANKVHVIKQLSDRGTEQGRKYRGGGANYLQNKFQAFQFCFDVLFNRVSRVFMNRQALLQRRLVSTKSQWQVRVQILCTNKDRMLWNWQAMTSHIPSDLIGYLNLAVTQLRSVTTKEKLRKLLYILHQNAKTSQGKCYKA